MKSPGIKGNTGKRDKNNDVTTPAAPDTGNEDTPTPDTNDDNTNENDNPSPPEEDTNQDTNQETTPNQLNSNDVKGFDPFGGLYGPGT
jgi:hypothetical protein